MSVRVPVLNKGQRVLFKGRDKTVPLVRLELENSRSYSSRALYHRATASLPLWDSVIVLCFVVRYFVSILVLQSS